MDMTEMYGEPISTYTDQDGIDDGMLVEVDKDRFPGCLFTIAVYDKIMEKVGYLVRRDGIDTAQAYLQVAIPLMMDVVMVSRDPRNRGETLYTGNDLEGNVTGKTLWFAANQSGGITVMFPEDN